MSGFLTQAVEQAARESAPALTELARETHAGKVLVIAERAGGALILCRERERAVKVDGKPTGATEKVVRPTSALADFAHAMEAGLI